MSDDKRTKRELLRSILGDLPPMDRPIKSQLILEEDRGAYILEKLVLDLNDQELVPAYFAHPKVAPKDGYPVVLYNHAHGGNYLLGKDELLQGRQAIQNPPYAQALADRGIASLCIDTWLFGERRGMTESELFKRMLWRGQVLWGMMVYDSLRAVDYLASRSDCNARRIGTVGLSMGSTMAWWTAALDERVRVCVDLCCLTDYESLIDARGLDEHGVYYYVPSLLKHFSTAEINALIAPRPHLGLAGVYDKLTPPLGLDKIESALDEVYAAEGAPEAWRMVRYNCGHLETAAMRAEVLAWLDRWL